MSATSEISAPTAKTKMRGPPQNMIDLDIYRSARLLIDQHGDEGAIRAAERADKLSDAGDLGGAATCRRVLNAIKELRGKKPAGTMH